MSPKAPVQKSALGPVLAALVLLVVIAGALWIARAGRGLPGRAPVVATASGVPRPDVTEASKRRRVPLPASFQRIDLSGATIEDSDSAAVGRLEGRVVSAGDARGIVGAVISVVGPQGALSTTSAADGAFALEPTREGVHEVVLVTAQGFIPFAPELGSSPVRFVARKGRSLVGVTLTLRPAIEYVGTVLDAAGKPVFGAAVRFLDVDDELELGSMPTGQVSDERGEFRFTAPDDTLLEATHPEHSPGRARVDFGVQVSRRLTIRLGERAGLVRAEIRGRVLDESGAAQPGVAVVARFQPDGPAFGAARLTPGGRTQTDERGEFRLSELDPGRYALTASDGVRAPATARGVLAGGAPVVLTLVEGAALRGRVTARADGAPVPAFTLVISARRGPLVLETLRTSSVFDADGQYRVEPLAPGPYVVSVVAHGFAAAPERDVEVKDETNADFVLELGARISGVVRDSKDKRPLDKAKVTLEGSVGTGPSAVPLATSGVTNERGEFELLGVGAGKRSLLAAASGHHGRVIGIEVLADVPPPALDIELSPTEDGEQPRIELTGIGAVLGAKGEELVIGRVIAGGGAAEVGLVPGDAIVAVDGVNVVALGFDGAIQRIRGPEGTHVTLLIRRAAGGPPAPLLVPRRRIKG